MSPKQSRPSGNRGARSAAGGSAGPRGPVGPGRRVPVRPAAGRGTRNTAARAFAAEEWMRSRNISLEIVTVLTIVVIGIFTLAPQVQIWFQQRQQIADLTIQVEKAKAELANMKVERKRWEDPVYIRSQARDRLYYVLPGEVSYLVMDANGINTSDVSGTMGAKLAAQRNTTEISTSIMRTKKNWVNSVMQSVIRAGLEEPVVPTATDKVGSK
jgi:cell division protein FtsB